MKVTELKKLIEKHTKDGVVDYESLNEDVNTDFNGVITKKAEEAKTTAINEVVKTLGIDKVSDLDSLKSAWDNSQKVSKDLVSELDTLKQSQTGFETQRAELEKEVNSHKTEAQEIKNKWFLVSEKKVRTDLLDDFMVLAKSRVAEDKPFETVVDEMLTTDKYKSYVSTTPFIIPKHTPNANQIMDEKTRDVAKAMGLKVEN